MKNILPQIAFTVCATIGTSLIENTAIANITALTPKEEALITSVLSEANDIKLSKQFASAVIKNNPVHMQYSNNEMSQICDNISHRIRYSGYGAVCTKDNKAENDNYTLDVSISDSRLKKFALDTKAEDRDGAKNIFERAVYLGVIKTYSHIRKKISQMYLDGSQEDKVKYNSFIQLTNTQ